MFLFHLLNPLLEIPFYSIISIFQFSVLYFQSLIFFYLLEHLIVGFDLKGRQSYLPFFHHVAAKSIDLDPPLCLHLVNCVLIPHIFLFDCFRQQFLKPLYFITLSFLLFFHFAFGGIELFIKFLHLFAVPLFDTGQLIEG